MHVHITQPHAIQALVVHQLHDVIMASEIGLWQAKKLRQRFCSLRNATEPQFAHDKWVRKDPILIQQVLQQFVTTP
jgi:hypothetical protein